MVQWGASSAFVCSSVGEGFGCLTDFGVVLDEEVSLMFSVVVVKVFVSRGFARVGVFYCFKSSPY